MVDSDDEVWDVGANSGYFTFCASPLAERVHAFEQDEELVEYLSLAKSRNKGDNVSVVQGTVGETVDLQAYPSPDVVVMDIEGWEYTTVATHESLIKDCDATWFVSVYKDGSPIKSKGEINPEGTLEVFRDAGCDVKKITSLVYQDVYRCSP